MSVIHLVKQGDFIRIEYTGYDEKNSIFDSTSGEIAKSLHGKEGALLVIYGTDRLIPGMEEALANMQKGSTKELQLNADKAFGHRNKALVRVMSEKDFYRSEIRPEVGLVINLDTENGRMMGTIKSVSGGRILVDFNHPLADKNVRYTLKLIEVIEKTSEKITQLISDMGINAKIKLSANEDALEIDIEEKPADYEQKKQYLLGAVRLLFPGIKDVKFNNEGKKEEAHKKEGKK